VLQQETIFYLRCILVFFVAAVTDGIWAFYIRSTSSGKIWRATLSGVLIMFSNSFITTSYINQGIMVFFAAFGGGFGTYIMMKMDLKKKNKDTQKDN